MSSVAVLYLPLFRDHAERISAHLQADLHEYRHGIFAELMERYSSIVCVMSVGIVVRGIGPHLVDKWRDPAVVAVSPDMKYAIPVIGGHHGANELAGALAGLGIMPVITTASEVLGRRAVERIAEEGGLQVISRDSTRAVNAAILVSDVPVFRVEGPAVVIGDGKVSFLCRNGTYAVGVGCRRGVEASEVVEAIGAALGEAKIELGEVFAFGTIERKASEPGLRKGIEALGGVLVYLDGDSTAAERPISASAATRLGLHGVAEPCALALSGRKELVLPKRKYGRVTVAIAR